MADIPIRVRPRRPPAAGTSEPPEDYTDQGQGPIPAAGAVAPTPRASPELGHYTAHRRRALAALAGGSAPEDGGVAVSVRPHPQQEPPSRMAVRRPDAESLNELAEESEEGGLPEGLGWGQIIGELPPEGHEDDGYDEELAEQELAREQLANSEIERKYKTELDQFRGKH